MLDRSETGHATVPVPEGIDNVAAHEASPVIAFPGRLPGFPGATRFVLRRADRPFDAMLVMQSAEDPDLRFLMLPCNGKAEPLLAADLEAACAVHGLASHQVAVLLVVHRRTARAGQPELSPAVSAATSRIGRPAVVRARAVRHIDGRLERARSGRGDR